MAASNNIVLLWRCYIIAPAPDYTPAYRQAGIKNDYRDYCISQQFHYTIKINNMKIQIKLYLNALKNLFFPKTCFCCEEKTEHLPLCLNCTKEITFLYPPLSEYQTKEHAFFDKTISITAYKEPLISLIHLFKYCNLEYLAPFFSLLMAKHLLKTGFNVNNYDLITAVPLHKYKLKIRGYNQAEKIAQNLSNYLQIPLRNDIIENIKFRPSQTKLTPHKRQQSIVGIFKASKEVKNKRIILIDDIMTTGSTVTSCSQALKEKGAGHITVITLSKTLKKGKK